MQNNYVPHPELMKRRNKLSKTLPKSSLILILSNSRQIRNGKDIEHEFRQNSDLWYFTGINQTDCAYLMIKNSSGEVEDFIYIQEQNPEQKIWAGEALDKKKVREKSLIYNVLDFEDLLQNFYKLSKSADTLYFDIVGSYPKIRKEILESAFNNHHLQTIHKVESASQKIRLYKSEWEIKQMKRAAQITIESHLQGVRSMYYSLNRGEDFSEYEFEAVLEYIWRKNSSVFAYRPIVAGGDNATTLHYNNNNLKLNPRDLVLVDAGCEYNYYASDLTRVFPINGKFSIPQKEIYEIVLKALKTATRAAAGDKVTIKEIHQSAVHEIISGLQELKIIKKSFEEIYENELYTKYFPHGTLHWLGLDTHDVGQLKSGNKKYLENGFKNNMAITIEPGLYFHLDDESVPLEYRGIGIRLEDNLVKTSEGLTILTSKMPKEVKEIEKLSNP
jgi:Xaa-Pro aminopeptidase